MADRDDQGAAPRSPDDHAASARELLTEAEHAAGWSFGVARAIVHALLAIEGRLADVACQLDRLPDRRQP